MGAAKEIRVAPITHADADRVVRANHYSGSVCQNSQLHLGVFLGDRLDGAMQFGPSMDKRKLVGMVRDTPWHGFLELNRMAFSEALPRNSESRALGVALRLIRRQYPHIAWVVSFADATRCGDGTIYRAAGFVLTGITKNSTIAELPDGRIVARTTITRQAHKTGNGGAVLPAGSKNLPGFMLRYVAFLDPTARDRLTVPILPFDAIEAKGAGMARGLKRAK